MKSSGNLRFRSFEKVEKLLGVLLNSQVHGQTDQGDADGSQGHDGSLGAGHEQLADDNVQTAGDGQDGDQGVTGNLVLALCVGHLLAQHDDTVANQSVNNLTKVLTDLIYYEPASYSSPQYSTIPIGEAGTPALVFELRGSPDYSLEKQASEFVRAVDGLLLN